ncbi:chitobiase/beta-hexosaminidase C-terminal domain-containing protein [Paenibacillus sp. PsM32]|uniref:chitobiase/beta-hexosaminidase C-terminal domain-containing protein n=1 Tax=Paenibacillus sp. PsM32 TaxID=3030536 RepID=UPI00263B565E|nr:chitobiase/beta-hexosaminidase C-terminal domain-containing protein [Paenibacillus sp. PsM32]MDN4617881.1 chitobiase/beta-hexosaminidase C-terminal domain-containing protein [Paenibacillus sp. PsM32]
MKKKARSVCSSIGIAILMLSLLLPCFQSPLLAATSTVASADVNRTVTINTSNVVQSDFLGIGVNIIPTNLMALGAKYGYNDAYWAMDTQRIHQFQPKVARVWFQLDWMEPSKGTYTWNSEKMQKFYQYIDALKASGTEVELNFGWKVGSSIQSWFNFPNLKDPYVSAPTDLPAYARSASALLNELINKRGYDNIKYMTFYNEPNGSWDFEGPTDQKAYFAQMSRAVSEQLKADGLRDRIQLWGPEETGALDWTQYMKQNADDVFDAYTFHVYGASYNDLGARIAERKSAVGSKPIVMTEFGWGDDNASNWDSGFANSVIRAANDGLQGALMWQLNGAWTSDPDGDTNGSYTMWDGLPLGLKPNKTYYSAGLLARYVPEHSQVLAVNTGGASDIRAAAFKAKDGNYTIVLESKSGQSKNVTFDFGTTTIGKTFYKMNYQDDVQRDGNALLPAVENSFTANQSFTDSAINSEYNVSIYTTAKPQAQVKMTPIESTVASGSTLTLNATVIDASYSQTSVVADTYTTDDILPVAENDVKTKEKQDVVNNNNSTTTATSDTYVTPAEENTLASASTDVTWSVVGSGNGTISSTGVYSPPDVTTEKLVAIKATSVADPNGYGIALIKVIPQSIASRVDAPTLSLKSGVYDTSEAVTVKTGTAGAEIRYTLDGSVPTTSSSLYTKPVILPEGGTKVFKAKAFKSGLTASGVTSALYKILQNSTGPEGYQFCMYEGGTCSFDGTASVAYGADGLFKYGTFTNGVACTDEAFGGDPTSNLPKRCYYTNDVPEQTPVVAIYNTGFEKPTVSTTKTGPFTSGWTFDSRSGVQRNGSAFGATTAPEGQQTAYLKTDGGVAGSITQQLNFPQGEYKLSFKAAKRTSFGGTQTFDVFVDQTKIGSYSPTSGNYTTYTTNAFTANGKRTIRFVATTTTGDNTAFLDQISIQLASDTPVPPSNPEAVIANTSFENPATTNTKVGPFTSDWVFSTRSGIQRNGSVFNPAANAPDGVQTAYLKTDSGVAGSISQSITFPAGTYALTFQAAKRTSVGGTQTFDVYVDNKVVGSYSPTSGTYTSYTTNNFVVTAGEHTIKFVATTSTGDNTAFIDQVKLIQK